MKLAFLLPCAGAHLVSPPRCAQALFDFPADLPPLDMQPGQVPAPQRVTQEPAWTGWAVGGDANVSEDALRDPSTRIGPCFVGQTGVVRAHPQVGEGATYINEMRMDDSGAFHLR